MSKSDGRHPTEDKLLLFLDGELDENAAESVRRHLDSCWSCRMHSAGIQNAIVAFAREREQTEVPEPPRPWRNLMGDFQKIHDAARPSLMKRIRMSGLFRGGRVAMFATAATGVAAITWFAFPTQTKRQEPASVAIARAPTKASSMPKPTPRRPQTVAEFHPPELPKAPDRIAPDPSIQLHEELAVVAELHRLKADLGEPIELERGTDGRLLLTAVGLTPDRAEVIHQALSKFPSLRVNFKKPQPLSMHYGTASTTVAARRPMAFKTELLQYAGGHQGLQKLADAVLDSDDQVTTYVHALDNFQRRFPSTRVALMSSDDRGLLTEIETDHRLAARQAGGTLNRLLEPVFKKLQIGASPPPAMNLLETALRLDRLVNAAFAGAQTELAAPALYGQIRSNLSRLLALLG